MVVQKKPEPIPSRLDMPLKFVATLLAIATFGWGIYTYHDAALKTAETRRIEASSAFLTKQLSLCIEVVQTASVIGTSADPDVAAKAKGRFKELFWGEMGLVEGNDVKDAMAAFHAGLLTSAPQNDLANLALALARACRAELAISWGTEAWKRPQAAAQKP